MMMVMMMKLVVLLAIAAANGQPIERLDAIEFLRTYGYIVVNDDDVGRLTDMDIRGDLLKFQHNYGLAETGMLDYETMQAISLPRCGVSDADAIDDAYDASSLSDNSNGRWKSNALTYHIRNMNAESRQIVREAFAFWQNQSGFTFTEVSDDQAADITLSVEPSIHQFYIKTSQQGYRCSSFAINTLAHANIPEPSVRSYVHFNSKANWQTNDFWVTATHEIGHTLGFRHVLNRRSIMYPVSTARSRTEPLDVVDKTILAQMYPRWSEPPRRQSGPSLPRTRSSVGFSIDASAVRGDQLLLFKNSEMWSMSDQRVRPISEIFRFYDNEPRYVSAACELRGGEFILITDTSLNVFDANNQIKQAKRYADLGIDSQAKLDVACDDYRDVYVVENNRKIHKIDANQLRIVRSVELSDDTGALMSEDELESVYDLENGADGGNASGADTAFAIDYATLSLIALVMFAYIPN